MRLRTVLTWGVLMGGAAVACGSDDESKGSSGGAAGKAGRAGAAGASGTKSSGGKAGAGGTSGAGGGTKNSGGSGGTTNSGGTSTSGGTGGTSTAGGTGGRGGATGLGGSMALGGAGEGGAGEGGLVNGTGGAGSGAEASGAGGEGGAAGDRVKQPLDGLIDMQIISWHNTDSGVPSFVIDDLTPFAGEFGGVVINAAWNQIQPTETGALDYSSIDDALTQVRSYNDAHPTAPLGVKLRTYAGSTAPDWAKAIHGGPVSITRNPAGCSTLPATPCPLSVPLFWDSEYITAWRAFQVALAARYDDEPLIRQVAVTSCAAQTDEPFVVTSDQDDRDTLVNDYGYTDDAEQACLMGAVEDYSAWKHTLVDYTFNPFNKVGGGLDPDFTLAVMDHCRSALGSRCVLDNHALSWPVDPNLQAVYDHMQALGGPINFQTQAPIPDKCQWTATIAQGVALGARAIEIWPATKAGFVHLTSDQVGQLAAEFTNPIPVPAGTPTTDCDTGTGAIFY
jgi:hypothetical protein